jgi:hypothetical protein
MSDTDEGYDEDFGSDPFEDSDQEPPGPSPSAGTSETREFNNTDLWKKWSVSGGTGRFLTIRPWLETGKVSVDIGETAGSTLKSHSTAWASLLALSTYLRAVRDGRAVDLYPADEKNHLYTPESFAAFGGADSDSGPVSRVFKVEYWPAGKDYDSRFFIWKAASFKGKKSSTGAFIPLSMKEEHTLTKHSIKVSRREMAEMAHAFELALINHASRLEPSTWMSQLSGRRKSA